MGAQDTGARRDNDALPVMGIDRRRHQTLDGTGKRAIEPVDQHRFNHGPFRQALERVRRSDRTGLLRRGRRVGRGRDRTLARSDAAIGGGEMLATLSTFP